MKTLKMNLSEFLHLSSFILLTWYSISILYIILSLVYFLCLDHAATLILCLCTLLIGTFFNYFPSIILSTCLYLILVTMYFLQGFFSNFWTLFSFLSLNFLTHTVEHNKAKKLKFREYKKQNHYY